MRTGYALVLLAMTSSPSQSEDLNALSWGAELDNAKRCVAQSEPDFRNAVQCYKHAIAFCVGRVPDNDYALCLDNSVTQLERLLPRYNGHKHGEWVKSRYDPERCADFSNTNNLPDREYLLQCEFIALVTQVTMGHIASIWKEMPDPD